MNTIDREIFEKKHRFFEETIEKLSSEESIYLKKKTKKTKHIKTQLFKYKNDIKRVELQIKSEEKTQKQLGIAFAIIVLIVILISSYREDANAGFVFLALIATFLFSSLMHHLSKLFMLAKISNIGMTIALLEAEISDIDLIYMPGENEIAHIYDEQWAGSVQDEEVLINKFNLEIKLAILDSMGYQSPNFW